MYIHGLYPYQISYGSLVIAIKPKAKYRFHEAAILVYYIPQKTKQLHTVSKIYYHTIFHGPALSVALISKVPTTTMLILSMIQNYKMASCS
jgi:hypothetical protein